MNEAKRVPDMTDQEVIAELRKWEAERDRLQRRLFAWVIGIISAGAVAYAAVAMWLIHALAAH